MALRFLFPSEEPRALASRKGVMPTPEIISLLIKQTENRQATGE